MKHERSKQINKRKLGTAGLVSIKFHCSVRYNLIKVIRIKLSTSLVDLRPGVFFV
jgi:hypothetical protein